MNELHRPSPTKRVTLAVCGGDNALLNSAYKGLYETPLASLYPLLNFDELLVFEAASWKKREEDLNAFSKYAASHSLYDTFRSVFFDGFNWLSRKKDTTSLSEPQKSIYLQLNPYQGNLEERLAKVSPNDAYLLREQLAAPVKQHVFEGQYSRLKRIQKGDNSNLVFMAFQPNTYPPSHLKGEEAYQKQHRKMVDAFAGEITRLVSAYPAEYYSIEEILPEKPDQLNLF